MTDPSNPYGGYVPPSGPPAGESEQPPEQPFGQPYAGQPYAGQPYAGQPYVSPQPYGSPQPGAYQPAYATEGPGARPGTVTAAAVLTWVGSVIGLLGFAVLLVAVFAGADDYYEGFQDSATGWSRDEISAFTVVFAGVGIVWCVAACVLAYLVVRRHSWARIVLTVSAAMAALLSLVTVLAIVPVLNLVMCVVAIVLLYVGRGNAWFRA